MKIHALNLQSAFALVLLFLGTACISTPKSYGPRKLESGLTVQEVVIPKSNVAKSGDVVSIHYHGTLPNGEVFDSTTERGQPLEFTLGAGEVPPGLDQGVTGMHLRGRRNLVAPIELMFPNGVPKQLKNVTQVYLTVELLAIKATE